MCKEGGQTLVLLALFLAALPVLPAVWQKTAGRGLYPRSCGAKAAVFVGEFDRQPKAGHLLWRHTKAGGVSREPPQGK